MSAAPGEVMVVALSLRDYFAGQAMQALIARDDAALSETLAHWAFEYADAMLEERAACDADEELAP